MARESHEKSIKIPLIINGSWPMKNSNKQKTHEKAMK